MNKRFIRNIFKHICISAGSVLLAVNVKAQTTQLDVISKKLEEYNKDHAQEKIFLHTDKSFYLAGEIVWFKQYVVNADDHKLKGISKLSYVEIIDKNGRAVDQAKIFLNNGLGSGSFQLANSLNSGVYVLRAYTNWMKNNDASFFFEQPITIINTLKSNEGEIVRKNGPPDIQFFPEGGSLIPGCTNKVAFKVVASDGHGATFTGKILDSHNNVVIENLKPLKFGMGNFVFIPTAGERYTAKLTIGNALYTKELPSVEAKGYSMLLENTNNASLTLTVSAVGIDDGKVNLLVHTGKKINVAQQKNLSNGKAVFNFPTDDLGEGISHLTVFNEQNVPVAERLYFKQPKELLSITTKTANSTTQPRQKVAVDVLTISNNSNYPANLSVSVFKADSLQSENANNIISYLWLTSELKGFIESPGYYFSPAPTEVNEAADNLVLTQGWRRFNWTNVLNNKKGVKFLPEYEGHLVKGTVINKNTGTPGNNVSAYLSSPGKYFKLALARSDEQGKIIFNIGDLIGSDELIVQTLDPNYKVEIESPFSENPVVSPIAFSGLKKEIASQLLNNSVGSQVQQAFYGDKLMKFALPKGADTSVFYGKPEKSYLLDSYTRFQTFEEVLREYIKEVSISRHQKSYQFSMVSELYEILPKNPLVLIDGVPFFNADSVVAISPMKFKKLDAVSKMYSFGHLVLNGIMSLSTYNNNLEGIPLDPNVIILEYEGMQLQRQFYSPVYDNASASSRLPDLRNVLYWNPSVTSGTDGKASFDFYTSDEPGTYKVVVQGITSDGKAGYSISDFKVSNDLVRK